MIRYSSFCFSILLLLASRVALSDDDSGVTLNESDSARPFQSLIASSFLSDADVSDFRAHPSVAKYLGLNLNDQEGLYGDVQNDSVSDYETYLPQSSEPRISKFERILLTAYLETPNDIVLAKLLAVHNLGHMRKISNGRDMKKAVLSLYFLNRALDLGANDQWLKDAVKSIESAISEVTSRRKDFDFTEGRKPHQVFLKAFNYQEEDRYVALRKLLDDFVKNPDSVITNAYVTASSIWIGGEAGYEDPTVIYYFILSAYFSARTIEMSEEIERRWKLDPEINQRFRLAPILGGWSLPARRWLAVLHRDGSSVSVLDEEHDKWLSINRAFHSASVGLMFFEEDENFLEGMAAWDAGFDHCNEVPGLRSCPDRPRFSFNQLSFLLGRVDYFLKLGDVDMASFFLSFRWSPPLQFENWTLGQDAWLHREDNLSEIVALYQNDNPSDDPVHFNLKRRKWGPSTITCQTCHQVQDRYWTDEEISDVWLPSEDVATIDEWPEFTTTWYGRLIE